MLKRTIDGLDFEISKLDVFDANDLDRDVQEVLPPVLEKLDGVLTAEGGEEDLDLAKIGEAMKLVFDKFGREEFRAFCEGMLKSTELVTSTGESEVRVPLNSAEAIGKIGLKVSGLYKLLWAVMEENGFIPFDLLANGSLMKKILESLAGGNLTKNTPDDLEE